MTNAPAPRVVVVAIEVVEQIFAKTQTVLSDEEQKVLRGLADSYLTLTDQIRRQGATMARLRRFLGMKSSEKTADVLGRHRVTPDRTTSAASPEPGPTAGATAPEPSPAASAAPEENHGAPCNGTDPKPPKRPPRKGHGRVPASAYADAECIAVLHEQLRPGDQCRLCGRGKLYELATPAPILRIIGQPPLAAVCWNCQRLRCSGCGALFTAQAPAAAQGPKYADTAVSMMALLRYRAGLPLHRLDRLERHLATPVPASTQWEVVNQRVDDVRPVFDELRRQAAQGQVMHNDDSYARILAFMGKRRAALLAEGKLPDPDRTGIFTTAIVSIVGDRPIALFSTSRKHAGENLAELLNQRAAGRPAPLLMSDALERNLPKGHAVDESNCLAHGRRHVVDQVENFPAECAHLLEMLGKVYRVDHLCRRYRLSPLKRLEVHRRWSAPVLDQLRDWITALFAEKRVEPNSGLGQAMNYLLKRWDKLTRFLHVPDAPLDNSVAERALKMAIRHRRNSLFYRSQNGADVGDIYMTLIYTAELHGQNPFDYLTALLGHTRTVAERPADWLPWNYQETRARLQTAAPCHPAASPAPARVRTNRLRNAGAARPDTTATGPPPVVQASL